MSKSMNNSMNTPVNNLMKQSGAVLVMSLVLLTVLTLIGVTSMSTATLELKVASNAQQHNVAFQAAQSRLDFASAQDPANPINFKIPIPDLSAPPVQTCDDADGCPDGTDWFATARVSFIGCVKGLGSSLESGKGFSYRFFDIRVDGQTSTGSSRSIQSQGVRFPVAGCEEDA